MCGARCIFARKATKASQLSRPAAGKEISIKTSGTERRTYKAFLHHPADGGADNGAVRPQC